MLKDWKLKFRYGKLTTPYKHFTLIAAGLIEVYIEHFDAQPGQAYAGMKIWASDENEAFEVFESVTEQIGFLIKGKMELFDSDAINPPKDNPYAYDIQFTYYTED